MQCLVDTYNKATYFGYPVDGRATFIENICDHGALNIAWDSWVWLIIPYFLIKKDFSINLCSNKTCLTLVGLSITNFPFTLTSGKRWAK